MKERILFLTTAHQSNDDRIFFHQAKELARNGFQVKVSSLSTDFKGEIDGIEIESYSIIDKDIATKKSTLEKIAESYRPHCIICSEPLAVMAAKKSVKNRDASLIYDVTEWYPSMRMLEPYSFFQKIFHFLKFFSIQLYAGFLSTHFIFGEKTKKFPLAQLFPFKKSIILPYFPDKIYVEKNIKEPIPKTLKLCYTGVFSEEKGVENFLEVCNSIINRRKDLEISILLIGGSRKKKDEEYFTQILKKYNFKNIEIRKPLPFEQFTSNFADADVCFDLREHNFENDHCLPIKIFYYAAAGKPVIYTNLKATREFVKVSDFGYLVNPKNIEHIASLVEKYADHPEWYEKHAYNARKLFEEEYNWNKISKVFVEFVAQSIKKKG